MSVQSELIKFNEKIRADYKNKSELAEKRDILIKKLRESKKLLSFDKYDQGSYTMHTGIIPESGEEYDIDVALIFNVNKDDHNPMDFKNDIQEILENHTDYGAEIKKPCVTVTYKKNGEVAYHVDLVVYTYEDKDSLINDRLYIAKGKNTDTDSQKWELADPKGLVNYINDKIELGEKRDQFRRVVRYLKKWRNHNILNIGNSSPCSIGLTLLACNNFIFYVEDDLSALINIVNAIKSRFEYKSTSESGRNLYRIYQSLPIELDFQSDSDVFEKMSDVHMTNFKDKIEYLSEDLLDVKHEVDETKQYKKLNKIFGDDFVIPDIKESAKSQANYIPSSSASGMSKW